MKSFIATTAATLMVFISPVFADDLPMAVEVDDIPTPIYEELQSLQRGGHVLRYEVVDLDQDGSNEVFVHLTAPMDPNFPKMLEWRVLDEQQGNVVQVGTWIGHDVKILHAKTIEDDEAQAVGSVPVIQSDGSYWLLYKAKMRPYGDLASQLVGRFHKGRSADRSAFSSFGLEDVPERYMARVELDVSARAGKEVLISLFGDGFARDSDGAAPYVLLSRDGELIHAGMSFTHPSIFRLPDGGFQVIEAVNFGYQVNYFPEEKSQ